MRPPSSTLVPPSSLPVPPSFPPPPPSCSTGTQTPASGRHILPAAHSEVLRHAKRNRLSSRSLQAVSTANKANDPRRMLLSFAAAGARGKRSRHSVPRFDKLSAPIALFCPLASERERRALCSSGTSHDHRPRRRAPHSLARTARPRPPHCPRHPAAVRSRGAFTGPMAEALCARPCAERRPARRSRAALQVVLELSGAGGGGDRRSFGRRNRRDHRSPGRRRSAGARRAHRRPTRRLVGQAERDESRF